MKTVVLFIDTNIFIQLRDLSSLPWQEQFLSAEHISIMVARPVIEELDEFKSSTNSRRRDRSRLALDLIDRASKQANRQLSLRDKPALVTLNLAPRAPIDWSMFPNLDSSSADDRLVAAAATYSSDAIILSHDSGPRLSADDIGLSSIKPPEEWMLAAEQSDDQRKISRLEREIRDFNQRSPKVEIRFPNMGDGRIHFVRSRLPPLTASKRKELEHAVISCNPKWRESKDSDTFNTFGALGIFEIDTHEYNDQYKKFTAQVTNYFSNLHTTLAKISGLPNILYEIVNTGNVSAMHLVATMKVNEAFGILDSSKRVEKAVGTLRLPQPPKIPERTNWFMASQSEFADIPSFAQLHAAEPRDPTEMQWHERPTFSGSFGTYGCVDFRPGRIYEDSISLLPMKALPVEGRFSVTSSVNDMAAVTASVEVILTEEHASWTDESILSLVPDLVKQVLLSE